MLSWKSLKYLKNFRMTSFIWELNFFTISCTWIDSIAMKYSQLWLSSTHTYSRSDSWTKWKVPFEIGSFFPVYQPCNGTSQRMRAQLLEITKAPISLSALLIFSSSAMKSIVIKFVLNYSLSRFVLFSAYIFSFARIFHLNRSHTHTEGCFFFFSRKY